MPVKIIEYIGYESMTYAPIIGLGIGVIIDYFIFKHIKESLKGFNPGGPN